ncbi:MAG: hypothetical protein JO035_09395 [Betaproteobacteria bacterium]|nr:hypothetical protein [Betaproteobacteria bacterium]
MTGDFGFNAVVAHLRYVPRMLVMAMIVATMLVVPFAGLLALAARLAFGVDPHAFVTFGHAISSVEAAVIWWAIAFVPSAVYSAFVMPWEAPR